VNAGVQARDIAWYSENSENRSHPVGQKQANAWGLHDMLGNVAEMVQDGGFRPYSVGAPTDPAIPESPDSRLFRGGSWQFGSDAARVSFRNTAPAGRNMARSDIGFRLLRESVAQAEVEEALTRGVRKLAQFNLKEALADFDRVIESSPSRDLAWISRASLRALLGDSPGMLADVEHAIEKLQTNVSLAYSLRATVSESKNQLAAALADFDRAIELGPEDQFLAPTYGERGLVRQRMGDVDGAKQDLIRFMERGIRRFPRNPSRPGVWGSTPPSAGSAYVQRPLFHFAIIGGTAGATQLGVSAVFPDGRQVGTFGSPDTSVMPAVWAPDGKHYAFLSVDPKLGEGITFANPDGEAHVPVRGVDRLVVWRIAWAPDSKRAAYLVISLGKLGSAGVPMLAIFDVASQRIVLHPIPRETLANYPSFTEGPDQLRWSPDGKKVLASWENVIVADAENGNVQTLLNAPAAAEWASSNAVYLMRYEGDRFSRKLSGLFMRKLEEDQHILLADPARLAALGFNGRGLNPGLLRLSPSGSRLAIGGGVSGEDPASSSSALVVLETRPDGLRLDQPVAKLQMDLTAGLDWSPDERSLAVATIGENRTAPARLELVVRIQPVGGDAARTVGTVSLPGGTGVLDVLSLWSVNWSQ
jgi:tetratricopeptide (TPR) repeat protein